MLRINDLNYFLLWIIPGIVGGEVFPPPPQYSRNNFFKGVEGTFWIIPGIVGGGVKIATVKCLLLFLSRVTSESGPV